MPCNFSEKALPSTHVPVYRLGKRYNLATWSLPRRRVNAAAQERKKPAALLVLRKFRAGVTVPAHIHPDANEFVYVLSGDIGEEAASHTPPAHFSLRREEPPHGPHFIAKTEVVSLTMFDGPLTIVDAE